jgi:hypothetical protein
MSPRELFDHLFSYKEVGYEVSFERVVKLFARTHDSARKRLMDNYWGSRRLIPR